MSRLATMFAALADTALAVVIGILAPLAVATAGWLLSGSFESTPWEVPLTAAMALWTLGLTSAVGFTVHPETFPSLQLADPFGFVVSLAPLAITAYVAWAAWRTGRRIDEADDGPWLSLAVSATGFIVLNQLALQLGSTDTARLDPGGVAAGGTLVWLVGLVCGARIWEHVPWSRLLGDRADTILHTASQAARLALGLVVGLFALASALVLVGLVLNMGDIVGLTQLLQLDAWGNIAVGLTELLYLPTLLIWAIAWLLGAGVQLGAGAMANPGATDAGPLPILPLFGIIPEPQGPLLWSLLAAPVLLAAGLTVWLRTTSRATDAGVWWQRLLVPAAGSVGAALLLTWLAYLARGAIGPGRLTEIGPVPWLVFLYAAVLLLVGSVVGAFVPVRTVEAAGADAPADANDAGFRDLATEDREEGRAARPLRAVSDEDDDFYAEFDDLDGPARDPWWRRVTDSAQDRIDALAARRRPRRPDAVADGTSYGGTKATTADPDDRGDDGLDEPTGADEFPTDDLSELTVVEELEDDDDDAPLTVVRRAPVPEPHDAAEAGVDELEPDETARDDAPDAEAAVSGADAKRRRTKKAALRRDLGDLADALRRPDEPDIYGDIDLDEAPKRPRK